MITQLEHIKKISQPNINNLKRIDRHKIAEACIYLEGKPLDLSQYKMFYPLYNDYAQKIIYKTGRQIAKSTTLAITMVLKAAFMKNYKMLYCTPLEGQMYKFSNLYVNPVIYDSPIIKRLVSVKSSNSVKVKVFKTGSRIEFSYTNNSGKGANRIRGTSSDEINWDEIQDTDYSIIPVVSECISASKYEKHKFCGTPKTLENTIEILWLDSSQNEWVVKCDHCGYQNIPILPYIWEMIGRDYPICSKCKKDIRNSIINNGEWVPGIKKEEEYFKGYHIPQIIVPFHLTDKKWKNLYRKYKTYPKSKFANEVLGLSFDLGGRLITITELRDLMVIDYYKVPQMRYYKKIAGVDWGITASESFTVLVILGVKSNGDFDVIFHKKYRDTDGDNQIEDIKQNLIKYRVDFCGCDWGSGHIQNQRLRKKWCNNHLGKLLEFFYVNSNFLIKWDKDNHKYHINRTNTMNILFMDIKDKKVFFGNHESVELEVFPDILAIYEEEKDTIYGKRKHFNHNKSTPDDFFHAMNYASITAKLVSGQLLINYEDDSDE